jgi:hypothetical protein
MIFFSVRCIRHWLKCGQKTRSQQARMPQMRLRIRSFSRATADFYQMESQKPLTLNESSSVHQLSDFSRGADARTVLPAVVKDRSRGHSLTR